jgi:hypothetical protein
MGAYSAENDWAFNINLRHVHMKAKYGLDLQFPLSRYVTGLAGRNVPDRDGEYPSNGSGQIAASYVGNNDCVNPLFAASLPDGTQLDKASLCALSAGSRPASDVFYAHIGGVPNELLHFKANDTAASALTASDWVKILGNDPDHFDYSGIDPHMIESYSPRAGLPPPGSPDDADPINGREWVTDTNPAQGGAFVDLQFACTFPLQLARDCTATENQQACDCPKDPGATWGAQYLPPLCGGPQAVSATAQALPETTQIAAKAYPTIREIELAKLMGAQGVLSSICPIDVADNETKDDPYYGYRPAVAAIVDRLKGALANECIPETLTTAKDGSAPCLVLEALPDPADTCKNEGFANADAESAAKFRASIQSAEPSATRGVEGEDIALNAICEVPSLTPAANPSDFSAVGNAATCKMGSDPGWCYVTGAAAGRCSQAIAFTAKGAISGSQLSLQCIENSMAASSTSD